MGLLTKEGIDLFSAKFNYDFSKTYIPKKKKNNGINVILADLHFPYEKESLLDVTIEETKGADTLHIAGDIFDMYTMSPYRKTFYKSFVEEFRESYIKLKLLAQQYPEVYIMITNHDNRPYKRLYDSVPSKLLPFCHTNTIEELIELLPNVKIVSQKAHGRDVNYMSQYKNIIFTHIEKSNADITKTAQEIYKLFKTKWEEFYELKPYNIVMQAHNHSSGGVWINLTYIWQIPCMIDIRSKAFDYVFDGKFKGSPPSLGYITCKEIDGKIDPNTIHLRRFLEY
jgi:hypothetical protein